MDPAPPLRTLYPEFAPYRVHALPVSGGHVLHVEESGLPEGIAALVLHGGPGSGSSPLLRRFFDPARYRIVSPDQRGAGGSRPRGRTEDNTTDHLITDLELLRDTLGIAHWLVVGGSWGAALALAYAAAHPTAVAGLLLRATFLARDEDVAAFFHPIGPQQALLPAIAHGLQGDEAPQFALAWWRRENLRATGHVPELEPSGDALAALIDRYRVQSHYLLHHCWLDAPPLLERCSQLPPVPTLLLHGTDDRICTPAASQALHQRLPHSLLRLVDGVGHDPTHTAMVHAMVEALDAYAARGGFDAGRAERRAAPKPARVPPGDRSTYPSDEGLS
ncbi:MAG TPA: alpha/beta fold hydrolase [Rhizobacter sp.]|nr:alpha/beta fold hydrolase [Rhizobacter sp.]